MPEREPHSHVSWAVREVDHLFSAFRRYTKFVFFSKWFLGVFALLLMSSLIIWPLVSKDRSGVRITFTDTTPGSKAGSPIASPVMENPQFQGTDKQNQQYKVTGKRAIQKSADLVLVEQVEGQLLRNNTSWMGLSADSAEYSKAAGRIELIGNVTMSDSSGYIFVTPRATVEIETMNIDGNEKVEGSGPRGNILATGFKIRDNGKTITFGGAPSRVTVHLEKMKQ